MDNTFTQTSSFKTTGPVTGMCTIEDGKIYELGLYNQRQQIGVTNQVYNELKTICDNYYNKLVELKVIVPPKTPEEIQQETATMMSAMLEQMRQMQQRLEEVEHNAKSKFVGEDVEPKSASNGDVKSSVAASTKRSTRRKQSATSTSIDE